MNYRFVLYPVNNPYAEAIFYDLHKIKNVFFCKKLKNRWLEKMRYFHTSLKANRLFKLPGQSIWYKSYYHSKEHRQENHIFAFVQGNPLGYDRDYLHYLKKYYPRAKLCFYWVNLASTVDSDYVDFVQSEYDYIYTDEPKDCMRYGWNFIESTFSNVTKWSLPQVEESDIFFVGGAKDRLDMLHSIYDIFTSQGYVCDFHIVNVDKGKQLKDGIVYNHPMHYLDVLGHCAKTKIILEIVQDGQEGATLRTCESIVFKNKLLTNNYGLRESKLFSSHVFLFKSAKDISPKEILESEIDYDTLNKKADFLNPIRFVETLGQIFRYEE